MHDENAVSMRVICDRVIAEVASARPEVIGLGSDGKAVFVTLSRDDPDRYVDVGVAEMNQIGVATGLALMGKTPCAAAIASFLLLRAYEWIRNDVCHHGLDVKLFGVGGGLGYGRLGFTHHMPEDVALLRPLPNIAVFVPADDVDAEWAVRSALAMKGPAYVRLCAAPVPRVHSEGARFEAGCPHFLKDGHDLLILAMGQGVQGALSAACQLQTEGIEAAVANMNQVKPVDSRRLRAVLSEHRRVLVVEEHRRTGGLASLVAEHAATLDGFALAGLGISEAGVPVGDHGELLAAHGLDSESIAGAARAMLRDGSAR